MLLKSTLQGVTDTPFILVMVESNDSAHTDGTNINALVNTEVAGNQASRWMVSHEVMSKSWLNHPSLVVIESVCC